MFTEVGISLRRLLLLALAERYSYTLDCSAGGCTETINCPARAYGKIWLKSARRIMPDGIDISGPEGPVMAKGSSSTLLATRQAHPPARCTSNIIRVDNNVANRAQRSHTKRQLDKSYCKF